MTGKQAKSLACCPLLATVPNVRLDNLPSEPGRAHEMPPNPQRAVGQMEGRPADQLGLAPGAFDGSLPHDVIRLEDVLRDELMQKGEDFEVQQLHIVEKLEKAHEELAKQWQELDMERTRSNEQQEELTQRLAREQTELQEQLEVEVQKRHQWEKQQQWFLEKQQQDLEDHWQQEQNRRKRQWEAEQEEEFIKLQRRFQELQQQFQERLESAVPPRGPPSPSRGFGLPEDDSLALVAPSLADVAAKLSARAQNQPTSPAMEQDPWQPEQTHTFRSLAQTILHPSTAWGSVTASRDVGQLDFVPGERIQLAIPAAWEETRVVPESEPRAEPRSVPQAGPRAEARSAPQAEPKAEPRIVPQAEARASPQAEARASPRLPQAEPRAEPRSVPQAEPRASPQAEARASPQAEARASPRLPQAEPRAEPRSVPQAEPRASPQAEARASPQAEARASPRLPQAEPRAEPRSVPQAEPRASPQAEPRGSPRPLPHAEPAASPRSVPQAEARASPRLPQAEPRAETRSVPQAEPRASPEAEARGSPRSLPQAEPRASPRYVPRAEPEPRSVPQAEASLPPAASPRSVPQEEARASSRSLPQAEPRVEPRSVPQAEPRGSPRSLPQAEPAASPRSVPQAETRASPRSLPQAEPSAEPRSVPQAEPRAEPRSAPQAEPKVEARFVPQAEPRAEPRFVPQAEPRAEPRSVPQAGPRASPRSVPQAGPRAEPRFVPQAEPRAEPRVVPPRTVPQPDRQKEPRSAAQAERRTVLPAEPVAQAELRAEPRFGTQAKPRSQPSSLHRLTQILGETDPATDSLWSDDKVEPGSDGAFQRALQGCGIWSDEQHKDDQHAASLTITASLQADHQRVVSQVPFGECVAEPSQLATSRMHHDGEMNGSAASRASYLKFLQREIAAQRTFVRNIKEARKAPVKNITRDFSVAQRLQSQDLTGTGETGISGRSRSVEVLPRGADTRRPLRPRTPQVVQTQEVQPTVKQRSTSCSGKFSKVSSDDRSWHCIVSPVNAGVRGALEVLVSQQAWAIPERPFAYIYSLCRAIQNCSLPARQHFDSLVMRDAAREGVLSPAGFSQRAFFCDENSKLSEVISSPFGFAAYKGKALLVALQLRHAERCSNPSSPDSASLTGRTIIAEIALGRCHTTHRPLQELGLDEKGLGAVPLAGGLDSAYRSGADSVYFPKSGVLAVLSPSRALPIFLAEYSRQLVGAPVTSQMRVTTAG
ncbi:unnamed protein product [Effrenium voratum]|nr:unnamed protein product [Effrenium voratum]